VTSAIYDSCILDCEEISLHTYRAPDFWAEYVAYRTLKHGAKKSRELRKLFLVAQYMCRYRHACANAPSGTTGAIDEDKLKDCVLELATVATDSHMSAYFRPEVWFSAALTDVIGDDVDESSPDFKRHLLSAAAWLGEMSLVIQLVSEGYNYYDDQ
jgi:hypothetical protein